MLGVITLPTILLYDYENNGFGWHTNKSSRAANVIPQIYQITINKNLTPFTTWISWLCEVSCGHRKLNKLLNQEESTIIPVPTNDRIMRMILWALSVSMPTKKPIMTTSIGFKLRMIANTERGIDRSPYIAPIIVKTIMIPTLRWVDKIDWSFGYRENF
jgi:hypothetical protein